MRILPRKSPDKTPYFSVQIIICSALGYNKQYNNKRGLRMSTPPTFDLATWLRKLEADMMLYLQARYIRHINFSSKVSKLFNQQAEEKSDFRKKLFSYETRLADLMKKNALDIQMLLKKTPTSLQAFLLTGKMLEPGSDQYMEDLVRFFTATTNDLYSANKKSTLLPILQNHLSVLAIQTEIFTLIETDFYNTETASIHTQIKQNYQRNAQHMQQQNMEFRLQEKLPLLLKFQNLQVWSHTLKEDIKLYLQARYIETNKSFFSPAKKLDGLGLKLFSEETHLPSLLSDNAFTKMMRGARGAKAAVKEIDGHIFETLEHLEFLQESAMLNDPALLKRLHARLEQTCKTLEKEGSASRLLPLLQLSSMEFAVMTGEKSTLNALQKTPQKIRQQLSTRAEVFRQEHAQELIDYKSTSKNQNYVHQFDNFKLPFP
jgi:hypothetical protein